jgi:uncharacterized protein (TIGR00255 family)
MTGFGRGTATLEDCEISVELNAVNRRNLETVFSLPKDWQLLERPMAEAVRKALSRGRVHCSVSVDSTGGTGGLTWNDAEVTSTLKRFDTLANRVGCAWPPSAETVLRVILALQTGVKLPASETAEPLVLQALAGALAQLQEMRAVEGAALADDLGARIKALQDLTILIREASADRPEEYRTLLMARLKQAGLEIELQDERVLKEVAIFADRCDITEELTRLDSHLSQFAETMAEGNESGIGRKLEFIVQEINREFNTIGSKANKIEVSKAVIEAKNEIERIREQVQNVE